MTAYIHRDVESEMRDALTSMPVVVVTGPRQSGKTTFLERDPLFRDRRYVTLDDHDVLLAAERDPVAFLSGEAPLTIDEAQRCPELFVAVKRAVDRNRRPGQYVLSGSANFALMKSVGDSLAGRAAYFTLAPFSRRERLERTKTAPFLQRFFDDPTTLPKVDLPRLSETEVMAGGFPPVVLGEAKKKDIWFRGYTSTYIERDVRQLARVADLTSFRTLLELVALRTASVMNQSEIGRDARITATTVTRWMAVMETSYVIQRLPPFLRSKASRLVKSPKVFICDSGLAAHLTRVSDIQPAAEERLRGPWIETYVAQNIRAILAAHRPDLELSYWNVQGRHEVDFVIHGPRRAIGVEVKASSKIDDRDLSGLLAFLESTPTAVAGILAYGGTETLSLGQNITAVPIGHLLA